MYLSTFIHSSICELFLRKYNVLSLVLGTRDLAEIERNRVLSSRSSQDWGEKVQIAGLHPPFSDYLREPEILYILQVSR